ncbi:MAG TPA: Rieske (2Fe-2S) protein [Candidatus Limnocylindrales bacterium]|nr:Rieske (2Fe-2S) protein [Candidatus Limnocylindrales bacterium]
MLVRMIDRLLDAQSGWAEPLGRWLHGLGQAIFHPLRPLRDLFNGTWVGHPLHALLTDAPIGGLTLALIFEVLDQHVAADVSLVFGVLAMLAAAVAGFADLSETDGRRRTRATIHATLMVVALILFLISLGLRAAGPGRALPFLLAIVGYLILAFGAHTGGLVVYAMGNMVDRHAFRPSGTKWATLEAPAELPEGQPVLGHLGVQGLALVRQGDTILALHDECAHAGGPLSEGTVVDGCLQCPWHGSRFRLADGQAVRGPTAYDQPSYEVRQAEAGGWEARRIA